VSISRLIRVDGFIDGQSWYEAVRNDIADTPDSDCCSYRFADNENAHVVVNKDIRYEFDACTGSGEVLWVEGGSVARGHADEQTLRDLMVQHIEDRACSQGSDCITPGNTANTGTACLAGNI